MHILNIYIIPLPLREQINWLLYTGSRMGGAAVQLASPASAPPFVSFVFSLSVYKQCLSVCVCMHECARSTRSPAHPMSFVSRFPLLRTVCIAPLLPLSLTLSHSLTHSPFLSLSPFLFFFFFFFFFWYLGPKPGVFAGVFSFFF